MAKKARCASTGNAVTRICTTMNINGMCTATDAAKMISSRNIVMENWSKMMWQRVVNKAVQMLASGPFGSHFL
ncbi:hypothetical protein KIN20_032386 [Parelaphostrongylus tenuis]|uniref:Uncharacterized protein n=1 Tax=Parelaphostrongylus tenuis TaxID=148309 RepID=A0AAD5R6I7_PARTN|nr:hypothetical protein KIN20_032386 [Parelaphostrongylus tenuis]